MFFKPSSSSSFSSLTFAISIFFLKESSCVKMAVICLNGHPQLGFLLCSPLFTFYFVPLYYQSRLVLSVQNFKTRENTFCFPAVKRRLKTQMRRNMGGRLGDYGVNGNLAVKTISICQGKNRRSKFKL